jgi:glycosyltransferase involved in cell wall biosynthesis
MRELAIILPIYNQEAHVSIIYDNYAPVLDMLDLDYELIFVVNGSKDNSFTECEKIAKRSPQVQAYNIEGSGWGRAVKYGIQKAQAKHIAYTNSARTNIEDLATCIRYALVDDVTIIKANRIIRESFIRRLGSVIYNFENRYLFKTAVWDVNGTPKIFPGELLKSIDIQSNGDLIDAELMAISRKRELPVVEIPIYATDRISGKSTTRFKSAWKMYTGLLKLKKYIQNHA